MSFQGRSLFTLVAGTILFASGPLLAQKGGTAVGRLVVVGDSLSAGFQNFSLFDSSTAPVSFVGGQKHGYAAVVAAQAGASLTLPLISYPGIPPALALDASGQNYARLGSEQGRTPARRSISPFPVSRWPTRSPIPIPVAPLRMLSTR